ncbi:hypothetical protein DR864_28845 (plasmid) [Runella rosea]|uniref:Uncharacterized protein n=1 Tax=Runella rosea TaxID=2259595 RepID=A0A344TTA2_9BACT|nr:hypothetical protein [Runella rosea]AXE21873.1 hypothetical protein DR864_28845 [Runella rosea]
MFKKHNLWFFFLLFFLGLCEGCRQMNHEPTPDDAAFFPLQVGDYWVYQVTQEKYLAIKSSLKSSYQFQEKIKSSYLQNGQLFYLVEESTRQTEQSAWKLTGIHTVYKSLSEVVSQENNVPMIELVFPILLTTSWNSNLYNTRPDTKLQYQNQGKAYRRGPLGFDRTISVMGDNDSTLVNQSKYFRIYAPNIGLVYREDVAVAFCQSSSDCIGKGIIESGATMKWELIASNRLLNTTK